MKISSKSAPEYLYRNFLPKNLFSIESIVKTPRKLKLANTFGYVHIVMCFYIGHYVYCVCKFIKLNLLPSLPTIFPYMYGISNLSESV